MRIPRTAARTLVLTPEHQAFLFRSDDRAEVGTHWMPPGGGVDPGESAREGALRELHEETGWQDLSPGPLLCTWEHDFTRAGVPVRQYEHLYLARGPHRPPTSRSAGGRRADRLQEWRWWSAAELSETTETLWPPRLPELLHRLRERGPRAGTLHFGFTG
ncbi:NUDIX hydrolase [Streptomyces sp. NPDC006879]|uniref:NUDIX hydrolase n=1 Tax=Streptomyces sp. NPDC006879 TaxID=3364767 RepID=UPI0036B6A8F9